MSNILGRLCFHEIPFDTEKEWKKAKNQKKKNGLTYTCKLTFPYLVRTSYLCLIPIDLRFEHLELEMTVFFSMH